MQLGITDSDGSATYTMPAYASSDGSHGTYSTTAPLYHDPNCQCHMLPSQPSHCVSPPPHSVQSTDSSNSSNEMTTSCTKEVWVGQTKTEPKVNRLHQPVAWVWTGLSISIFALSTLTLTQSGWLVNGSSSESIGLIKQCKKDAVTSELDCTYYRGLSSLDLPSISWQLALIFFCIADTLLALSSSLALGTTLLRRTKMRRHISFFTGYVQLFAGKQASHVMNEIVTCLHI